MGRTGSKADNKKDSAAAPLLVTEFCSDSGFMEVALKCSAAQWRQFGGINWVATIAWQQGNESATRCYDATKKDLEEEKEQSGRKGP